MEIVQYHNDINKLKLGEFTENETDLFFTFLMKAKETKEDIIIFEFSELKKLAELDRNDNKLVKNIILLNEKLGRIRQTIEREKGVFVTFGLVGDITTDTNKKIVEIPINPKFRYLINDLVGNFTLFDLKELVSLKGKYSKTLYRLLKQWETTRKLNITIEEFRNILGIPESYAMGNIDQKVLEPCTEELKQYFKGLKVKKVKRGVKIAALEFTWRKPKEEKAVAGIEPIKYKHGIPEGMEQYRNGNQKDIYEEIEDREAAADQQITEEQEKAAIQKLITVEAIPKDFLETMKKKNHQLYVKTISKYIE